MNQADRLRPTQRDALLHNLKDGRTFDVAVIGGGATGLGVALDAAARGYSVALFESEDFAKGTSSRSTKLVHGGVRYLAQGNIALVREALHERATVLRNAPPALGQHTDEVLSEMGLDAARIAALRASGVV